MPWLVSAQLQFALNRADPETPTVQLFCRAGLCPSQFSLERVFEISQKATLGDAHGELNDFKLALQLSPASAYRWADLSEAEFNVRDFAQAEYAISRALKAGPRSPVILMRAANVYFQMGDTDLVARQLRKVLSDPGLSDYYETAFPYLQPPGGFQWRKFYSAASRYRHLSSPSLLTFWTKVNRLDEALATWKWASERHMADNESTGAFFGFLIKAGPAQEAQQLWQTYAASQEPSYRSTNWIFNPGFEHQPLISPFDWNIYTRQDVEAVRVQDVKYEGASAFRIRFNGETNTAYHQAFQSMVLTPGTYQFSVMMKTEQVTTR